MSQLGERLFEERKQKDITLDQLQEITKIQKRYLKAIEDGNYDVLPGSFYVRAFVKQYADAVGLNGDEIVEEYKNELPLGVNEEFSKQLSRVNTAKNLDRKSSKIFDILPILIIALLVVGILLGVWYFFQSRDSAVPNNQNESSGNNIVVETPEDSLLEKEQKEDEKEQATKEEAEEEATEEPNANQKINVVSTSGQNSVLSVENNDTFEVTVKISGRSYLRVTSSESTSPVFEDILEKDKEQTWNFDKAEEASIRVGYTPGVELSINGQIVEFPSESTTQTITIQNLGKTTTEE